MKEEVEETSDKTTKTRKKKVKVEISQKGSPFPTFTHPTHSECREVYKALGKLHGVPRRPASLSKDTSASDCGEVPNVIQAIVRTILSQNTTQENGSRAYKSMESKFGRMNWEAINQASHAELAEAIACGGLGKVKANFIKLLLADVLAKYGKFSLDHFHNQTDEEVFSELVKYKGVGPKTASCVLLFCLKRESFAVDTHIFRITKKIGWIPPSANREQAFLHLDERMPKDLKYPLHTLLIRHGKSCKNCAANGKTREKKNVIQAKDCPLRKTVDQKANEEEEEEVDEDEEEEEKEYVVESVSLEVEGIGK